jgi:ribosomal protein L29
MATTEQVAEARERVDALNREIAEERAKSSTQATENVNDLRVAQLNAEAVRLTQELARLKQANEGTEQAVEQMVEQTVTGTVFGGPTTAGDTTGDYTSTVADDTDPTE